MCPACAWCVLEGLRAGPALEGRGSGQIASPGAADLHVPAALGFDTQHLEPFSAECPPAFHQMDGAEAFVAPSRKFPEQLLTLMGMTTSVEQSQEVTHSHKARG